MEAVTVLDQREIRPDGTIQVRLEKQIVSNGEIVSRGWHRFSLQPGEDIDAMMATVDQHLSALGYPPVEAKDKEKVENVAHMAAAERRVP